MKQKEMTLAKRIYVNSYCKPSIYQMFKDINKKAGYKIAKIDTLYGWVKKFEWEDKRIELGKLKECERIKTGVNEEKIEVNDINKIVLDTILEIQTAIRDRKYEDTGTLSSLGQAVASLTKIRQLLEGKPTDITAIFGSMKLEDIQITIQAFNYLKSGNIEGFRGIVEALESREKQESV